MNMSKIFGVLFGLLAIVVMSASRPGGKGIDFSTEAYSEVLKQAKTENKLIFVDLYTSWCAPCKWLDKNVFNDSEVGSFYNTNFINVHYDAMKGDGSMLADKNNVRSVPSFLYINGDGKVVMRGEGAIYTNQLIDLGKKALQHAN